MHPMSPALAEMVARTAVNLTRARDVPADPSEVEQFIHRALDDLRRTRPRIIEFAPREALRRILARPGLRTWLAGATAQEPPATPRRAAGARNEWQKPAIPATSRNP
jgi:hypothetical protein